MLPIPDPSTLALFLDFDGTLVEIAARPQDVVVRPTLLGDLRALSELLDGALAVVSGRAVADIDAFLHPLRLRCAGIHGAELRFVDDGSIERTEEASISADVLAALQHLVVAFPGVTIENKTYSYAVHYRAAPALGPSLGVAMRSFVEGQPDLTLMAGHCIYEVKRPLHSKGTAVTAFMNRRPFAGRTPIFVGDDVTDSFGFEVVRSQGGKAYSVGREMDAVDGWFASPLVVHRWLEGIVGRAPVEP